MEENFYKEKIRELYDLFPVYSPPFPSNSLHDLLINSDDEVYNYARPLLGLSWDRG